MPMTKTQRRQKIEVQLRRQDRDPLVLKSLPPEWKSSEESKSLAEKLVSRVEWMQENGIDGSVSASEPQRSTRKSPRPGTVIYFSRVS
jgi:hypothetical protein